MTYADSIYDDVDREARADYYDWLADEDGPTASDLADLADDLAADRDFAAVVRDEAGYVVASSADYLSGIAAGEDIPF